MLVWLEGLIIHVNFNDSSNDNISEKANQPPLICKTTEHSHFGLAIKVVSFA